jgi:hypothetical protein
VVNYHRCFASTADLSISHHPERLLSVTPL